MSAKRRAVWILRPPALAPLLWLLVGLPACLPAYTVTDALGRTVGFERVPERIVMVGRGMFMVADAVYLFPGAASRIVALSEVIRGRGNFTAAIDERFDRKVQLPSQVGPEQVAAMRPDAVLLKSYLASELGASLERLGIPVLYLELESPEQYDRDLAMLGRLFQQEERSDELRAFFRERAQLIARRVNRLPEPGKPRVLFLYYNERDGQVAFNVPPAGWMQTRLVEMGGGLPVWRTLSLGSGWTKVSFEQIAAWDPDQIYLVAYFSDLNALIAGLQEDPRWKLLRAVRQGALHAFPGDFYTWDQPDPRWILGLQWLATRLHPELFFDVDLVAEMRAFFRLLYGLGEEAFRRLIEPELQGDLP